MTVASVCRVGGGLDLTCTASVEFIRWRINERGSQADREFTAFITSRATTNQSRQIVVNSAIFTFVRNSAYGVLPLISTLSIDSVSIDLNGTIVNCEDTSNTTKSASTTIQIIDTSNSE